MRSKVEFYDLGGLFQPLMILYSDIFLQSTNPIADSKHTFTDWQTWRNGGTISFKSVKSFGAPEEKRHWANPRSMRGAALRRALRAAHTPGRNYGMRRRALSEQSTGVRNKQELMYASWNAHLPRPGWEKERSSTWQKAVARESGNLIFGFLTIHSYFNWQLDKFFPSLFCPRQ